MLANPNRQLRSGCGSERQSSASIATRTNGTAADAYVNCVSGRLPSGTLLVVVVNRACCAGVLWAFPNCSEAGYRRRRDVAEVATQGHRELGALGAQRSSHSSGRGREHCRTQRGSLSAQGGPLGCCQPGGPQLGADCLDLGTA